MVLRYRFILNIILLWGFSLNLPAQNYRFLSFGIESGLCDRYIYTIQQDRQGFLWLGTGVGICRYDGINFVSTFQGDSLPSGLVTQSFIDSKGRPWFGFSDGSIVYFEGQTAHLLNINPEWKSRISGFSEDSEGRIFVATQNKGLLIITSDFVITQHTQGLEGQLITSFKMDQDGTLLVGTFDGLFIYTFTANEIRLNGRIEEIPYTRIQSIRKSPLSESWIIGTEDAGLFILIPGGKNLATYRILTPEVPASAILDAMQDFSGNLWVCTNGDGIFKLNGLKGGDNYSQSSQFGKKQGLNSDYIGSVFEDAEGNMWFGNAGLGDGLSVLKDQAFTFNSYDSDRFSGSILAVAEVGDELWLAGETGILIENKRNGALQLLDQRNGLPKDRINALYVDRKGIVWVGTGLSGLYQVNRQSKMASRVFISQNSLENTVNAIDGSNSEVWVATNGGVIRFDLERGTNRVYTTSDRLPHNKISDVFVDSRGKAWIATRSNGLYCVSDGRELRIDVRTEMEFVSITEDQRGQLWAVTSGSGVFEFSEDSLKYYSVNDGLLSNYGYSIQTDSRGNIWVGHRLGISRISADNRHIRSYSIAEGFRSDCNYNAVLNNKLNNLLIGTTSGTIEYDPSADKPDTLAPMLNITSLRVSDRERDFSKDLFLPYSIYKIRIEFVGINFKAPESVSYQYRLKGYDEWSEPGKIPYVLYSRVEDGDYTFELKACDENGICSETPLQFKISIKKPIWKTWWFIVSLVFLMIGTVFFIIKMREKKAKELQEYLQKALDERTREVMEQKEEIENKNRDITDSINYAQRIQASILPPIRRLNETFSGNFVFYQPRDIVSGDFYWYDRIWDNKFVIVCADSTGHGVPGAFMSMIGTTLIKDICSRDEVRSPAAILRTLDREIRDALNQNVEAEKSNDGMDIIVAEINLDTMYLRIASAMRPMIIYSRGEQVYIKGSRSSVGGRYDEETSDKEFLEQELQLNKGDILYMFSDGYPDQFGGPLGKKFKMVRLKNLLRDIHDKPMDEQYNYIKSNFMLWKEDLEQVDDVLFMGIKI